MARLKTTSRVSSERIVQERRNRFNPIRNFTPQVLVRRIEAWDAGYIGPLARTFAALESRTDDLLALAPARYEAAARLPWEICIVEGEQENPAAQRQRAALLYLYNNLTATDATEQHQRGGIGMLLRKMARAIGDRYSVHELIWRPQVPAFVAGQDGAIRVTNGLSVEARFIPLWMFENTESRLRYLPTEGLAAGVELEEDGWLVAVGQGLMIATAVNEMFQKMALNDWAAFNRDFGRPLVDAATDAARGSPDWNGLKNDLEELFQAKALLHGRAATVGYTKATEGQATYDAKLERLEKRLIRLWRGSELAQKTGASESVGATNQATSQAEMLEGDAAFLTETCNEGLDKPALRWNFGDEAAAHPLAYFRLVPPRRLDVTAELKTDDQLIGWGAQMTLGNLGERYGRAITNGDDIARPQSGMGVPPVALENESSTLAARIQALSAITDPAAFTAAIADLRRDLPNLVTDLTEADAAALARAMEAAAATELTAGIAQQRRVKP